MSASVKTRDALAAVDHLLLAVPDLDAGIAWVEERTGVRAQIGGSHPGRGTRNALLGLGGRRYLEILAPDPAQSGATSSLRELTRVDTPTLARWAAWADDLHGLVARLRAAAPPELTIEDPVAGGRTTPAGAVLRWRTLSARGRSVTALGGLAPFFIEWAAETPHPALTAPALGTLESLRFVHPDPPAAHAALRSLGLEGDITAGERPALRVSVRTGGGLLELG